MITISRGRALAAGAVIVLAGLLAACGGTSGSGTAPPASASPPASAPGSGQATATAGLQRFREVATGPLARAVQQDAVSLNKNASDPAAAEPAARKLATDLAAWAAALRSVPVPAQAQAIKDRLLLGLSRMTKGATEFADGLRNHDSALVRQGQADVQAGASIISQMSTPTP